MGKILVVLALFFVGCSLPHAFIRRMPDGTMVEVDGVSTDEPLADVVNESASEVMDVIEDVREDTFADADGSADVMDVASPDASDVRDVVAEEAASDATRDVSDASDGSDAPDASDASDAPPDVPPPLVTAPIVVEYAHVDPRYPGRDVPSFADYWWRVEYTMPVVRVEDWRRGRCMGGIVMISATTSRCTLDVPVPDGTTIKFYPVFGGDVPVCPRGASCPVGYMERYTVRYGMRSYDNRRLTLDFEFVPTERQFVFLRVP